ncbi:hypothetical protein POI8812_00886 [Pontivivens insulae]|uniref:Uncharacterized protein n=1 Tax=Pontivivens insulae TaxID=1639689 RepID=A0A2R8A8N1_9RHOB|nr:hypothetical protein DFR53_0885 [Pontivivens insulae]SPF28584.1 hypothetical protein POI8812_00886 [Pontivivens insulae]
MRRPMRSGERDALYEEQKMNDEVIATLAQD